jgi:hypothetical protein
MIRLSSSSSAISGAISGTLTWSKISRSRDYELQLNGEAAGTLRRPGWFETSFLAETPDGQWTFRRGGCFGGGSEIFSSNSDSVSRQPIASFKSSWGTGGGTLTFADGQTFSAEVRRLVASSVERDRAERRNTAAPAGPRENRGTAIRRIRRSRAGEPIVTADHVRVLSGAAGGRRCRNGRNGGRRLLVALVAHNFSASSANKKVAHRSAPLNEA